MPVATLHPPPAVQFASSVAVVSDYRFRGISLSDRKPALQAGVTATLAAGWYASAWGSTIDEYASPGDPHGATVELDLAAGRSFQAGGFDLDGGIAGYTYPRAQDLAYLELPVSVSRNLGPVTLAAGGAYAPSQSALGHDDNGYGWSSAAWEVSGTELKVQTGYERGAFAPGGKWDWSAGVARKLGPVRAGLSYVDTNRASGPAGILASFELEF